MTSTVAGRARSRAVRSLPAWLPWWAFALGVWLASRVVSTIILLAFASVQDANAWTPAQPSLAEYSTMWDAHWYYIITQNGYPSTLPLDAEGVVDNNAWAFMPVYPMLARAIMLTGLPWEVTSLVISLAASAGFAVVVYRLFLRVLPSGAGFALALVLLAPTSPVLQLGYAESLGMLLLAATLLAWVQRDWLLLVILIPIAALTRPMGLALAFAMALAVIVHWARRETRPWPVAERWLESSFAVWAGIWGLAWFLICWATTGDISGYTDTELVWRADYVGRTELVPFTAWMSGFVWWFGGEWGPVLLVALVAAAVLLLRTKAARRMGEEGWLWTVAYLVYLLAVWFPQSSTFRLLMPVFPVAGAIAIVRPAWARIGILVASVALQIAWVDACWHVHGADWTVP